jgi:divalent metal cation (Fe/Co/Zn/Cd) transporter
VDPRRRHDQLSAAIGWSAASIAWAGAVGAASLVAGFAASSLALVGFGANSLLDASASGVLIWRFRHERSGGTGHLAERRAAAAVGVVMIAVGLFLGVRAIASLADHSVPDTSSIGIALTSASVFVLPVLARAKWRLAGSLGSRGLRGDALLSSAGAVLAAATLLSLALNAAFDWWWGDASAALLIAAILVIEGSRTVASR